MHSSHFPAGTAHSSISGDGSDGRDDDDDDASWSGDASLSSILRSRKSAFGTPPSPARNASASVFAVAGAPPRSPVATAASAAGRENTVPITDANATTATHDPASNLLGEERPLRRRERRRRAFRTGADETDVGPSAVAEVPPSKAAIATGSSSWTSFADRGRFMSSSFDGSLDVRSQRGLVSLGSIVLSICAIGSVLGDE
mmetsp:Transcript_27003/g.63395  ORF Transcript_27003/g.63395 Transcript_27003/m.63395 type:complete len:201 (-) Transcript_27003:101-703(-)